MSLPTSPMQNDLTTDRLRAIAYGRPGAGKTTLASSWHPSSNLLIDLEGGTRWLPGDHFIVRPANYSEFMQVVHELTSQPHDFKTVTIDTVDNLVRMADSEAGQRNGKVAAGLVEYGKGLADRDGTILRDLRKLLATDLGVILVAHPTTVTDTDAEGNETERLYPRIDAGDRIRQEIIGLVDFVFYVRKDDHMVVTGGDSKIDTKRRVPLPDVLPADAAALAAAIRSGVESLDRQPVAA